jgi:hypothetical protein
MVVVVDLDFDVVEIVDGNFDLDATREIATPGHVPRRAPSPCVH